MTSKASAILKKVDEAILATGEATRGSENAIADTSALYDGLSEEDIAKFYC